MVGSRHPGAFFRPINNGPAVDPKRPGVLYYSAYCPTLGPGRMDIFAVPAPTR